MKLQIGNFHVKDVVFGETTQYKDGILSINKEEALEFIQEDSHITFADIEIAKPGEDVRIVPVKEAAEPRARVDGRTLFPGVTGELAPCGEGELHALKGVSVLGVGKHWGSFGDGLVDMSGEGQKYTLFGSLINVCLVIDDDVEEERHEQQKKNRAIRWATHLFAEYLGKTVLEQTPDEVETYELPPVLHRGPEVERLPSVVLVMQPQSQMEEMGYNDLVYGRFCRKCGKRLSVRRTSEIPAIHTTRYLARSVRPGHSAFRRSRRYSLCPWSRPADRD
jgi:hypothetical protein